MGFLARESVEFLHSTRLLGNMAAHEMQVPSKENLNTAIEVVEHLLVGVYILPQKASDLPKRGTNAEQAEEAS